MRLTKNGITYEYFGNNLIKETRGTDVIEYVDGTSGKIGFVYNSVPYYYIRNVLGDVKGILDANGNLVAEYKYDAWGNCTVTLDTVGVGAINPIRYRGYYYDTETGLYYLQTRYYDPEIGRFISPDNTKYLDPETLGGLNLYAYCLNNPIMFIDSLGNLAQKNPNSGWGLTIKDFKNKDGSYSLYDNTRFGDKTKYHEQLFVFVPVSDSIDVVNGYCLGGSFILFTGGWENERNDLSLLDFFKFSFEYTYSPEYKSFKIGATCWAPSYTFKTYTGQSVTISLSLGLFEWKSAPDEDRYDLGPFSISIS